MKQIHWAVWTLVLGACASTPQPKPWRPDPGPELRARCQGASAARCREVAEEVAAAWTADTDAFGAAMTFSAACEAGDGQACTALDARFRRPRYLGPGPAAPPFPKAALLHKLNGTWAALCQFTREGTVQGCRIERGYPEVDAEFVAWITAGHWDAPRLDGRPFGCEYRLELTLRTY